MLKPLKDSFFAYRAIAALTTIFALVLVLLPQVWPGLTLDVLVERSAWTLAVLAVLLLLGMALLALRHMLGDDDRDPDVRRINDPGMMGR